MLFCCRRLAVGIALLEKKKLAKSSGKREAQRDTKTGKDKGREDEVSYREGEEHGEN